jgi:hypothetical protein
MKNKKTFANKILLSKKFAFALSFQADVIYTHKPRGRRLGLGHFQRLNKKGIAKKGPHFLSLSLSLSHTHKLSLPLPLLLHMRARTCVWLDRFIKFFYSIEPFISIIIVSMTLIFPQFLTMIMFEVKNGSHKMRKNGIARSLKWNINSQYFAIRNWSGFSLVINHHGKVS